LNTVGNKVGDWLEVYDTYYEIYVDELKVLYPLCSWIYLGFATSTFENAYIKGIEIVSINDFEYLKKTSGNRQFVVPPHIPCVIGKIEPIYLDNVLKYGDFYSAEKYVVRNKAGLIEGAYNYEPSTIKETLVLEYYNADVVEKQTELTVKPVPVNAGSGLTKKCIFIGESTTDNPNFIPELKTLFDSDVMNVELMGTRGVAPANHEGYSGWSSNDFFTSGDKGLTNAFFNGTTFNFSYYMIQQGYTGVDYVFINLGINDSAEGIPVSTTITNYNAMLTSIKAYDSNIKVFFGLSTLPAKWKNSYYYAKPLKDTIQTLIESLINTYGNRENEGIYLTPLYVSVDPYWDMQYTEQPLSARNSKTVIVGTDSVHPSVSGYWKMASTTYNMIKYVAQ
jgi:lysophospholipase L1-like esterase